MIGTFGSELGDIDCAFVVVGNRATAVDISINYIPLSEEVVTRTEDVSLRRDCASRNQAQVLRTYRVASAEANAVQRVSGLY